MTKAQEQAARVEANKWDAYRGKVYRLTGQRVYDRVPVAEVRIAYEAGKTADAFAAEVAYREPVGAAVHPMKAQAVADATKRAEATVERVRAAMEAAGGDLQVAAPYPWRGNSWDLKVRAAKDKYNFYSSLTKSIGGSGRMGAPDPREMSPELIARFIAQSEEMAAGQYDAFTVKLVSKVGDNITGATLEGSHVWGHSFLTVTKTDGTKEVWKTQQIVNTSSLGNPYYQWPTRLMKGAQR